MNSSAVSASFTSVTFFSRISYRSFNDPTLAWFKCLDGDIVGNTDATRAIYNYCNASYAFIHDNRAALNNVHTRNGKTTYNCYAIPLPSINLSLTPAFTYCCWINYGNTGNLWQSFCNFAGTSGSVGLYVFYHLSAVNLSPFWNVQTNGSFTHVFCNGDWTHLSLVHDNVLNKQMVFVNGMLFASFVNYIPVIRGILNNNVVPPGGNNPIGGYMQDMRLYNRAITDPAEYTYIMSQ